MKLKTLIVEDESSLLELLKFNFIKDGFKVDTATDGEMALEKILNKAPDLLILDWMLPKLSGIELCRRIRKNKELKNLPIIMLTARGEEEDRLRGLETGAALGYLLYGPFTMTGPLRNSDFALTAGLLAAIGAVHILTALLVLYNAPGKAPNVQPPDATVNNPPADLFTRAGWADFTSGFWLGGCGGAVFAWLLVGTLHLNNIMQLIQNIWTTG